MANCLLSENERKRNKKEPCGLTTYNNKCIFILLIPDKLLWIRNIFGILQEDWDQKKQKTGTTYARNEK